MLINKTLMSIINILDFILDVTEHARRASKKYHVTSFVLKNISQLQDKEKLEET